MILKRETVEIDTALGRVPVKAVYWQGERLKAKPEYKACRRIAKERIISLRSAYEEVARRLAELGASSA